MEYIKFTKRIALTEDYVPTEQEIELYHGMSGYLQRPKLYALPASQRQLISMVLRKLLASSSFAIASTLDGLSYKLKKLLADADRQIIAKETGIEGLEQNFENYDELADEWSDQEDDEDEVEKEVVYTEADIALMKKKRLILKSFVT